MMAQDAIAEQRARDELAFEPLPDSPYISIEDCCIAISVNYSEPLSGLLRSILGAKWRPELKRWEYPFTSANHIRELIHDINRLGAAAKQRADTETKRRAKEHAEREGAAQHARDARVRRAQKLREDYMLRNPPRPFRREYLLPIPGSPVYHLSIEAIGDDIAQQFGRYGFRGWSGWVAQLFGSCPQKRWQRSFLKGSRDYTKSNSIGSRGVTINYFLEQGPIYEVNARTSWKSLDRYFLRITDSVAVRMTEDELRECLER